MRVSSQLSWIQRAASRFLASSHVTHVVSILLVFVPLRVFVSLRDGIVPTRDGVVVTGVTGGRVPGCLLFCLLSTLVGGGQKRPSATVDSPPSG